VTTTRGDVQFVVTEFGVADLRGKSIMERALALIGISHPRFRAELLMHAKSLHYVYQDQMEAGYVGMYPEQYEQVRVVADQEMYFRPAKPTDEPMLKEMFYSLSRDTVYNRFMGLKRSMPHRELMRIVNIDYDTRMTLCGFVNEDGIWSMTSFAMYDLDKVTNTAEISFAVSDRWQNKRIGTALMDMMIGIARDRKIKAFTAELLGENMRMLDLFYRTGLKVETRLMEDTYLVTIDLWSIVSRKSGQDGSRHEHHLVHLPALEVQEQRPAVGRFAQTVMILDRLRGLQGTYHPGRRPQHRTPLQRFGNEGKAHLRQGPPGTRLMTWRRIPPPPRAPGESSSQGRYGSAGTCPSDCQGCPRPGRRSPIRRRSPPPASSGRASTSTSEFSASILMRADSTL
jgi:ribosomal protein S18 acetylase RimI-like enzyme